MDNSKESSTSASDSRRTQYKEKEHARKQTVSRQRIVHDDDKDDINELADAFIKNFRNQLKIQRVESLKRFHEMIARGV